MRPADGGRALARAAHGAAPGSFAMVMATGIVSVAGRGSGLTVLSAVLLVIAAAGFVLLAAASCWRAAVLPAALRGDLTCPGRAFASFAFVAACGVLGSGLASARHAAASAVLAWAALAAWLVLTCLIPARLAARPRARPAISDVNGTWYLWAVATQSLAIAAVFLNADGSLPAGAAVAAAIAAWSAGVIIYLTTTGLVAARLVAAGLGPAGVRAPYWVAMGAASISVLAAAQILAIPGTPVTGAARAVVSGIAVALWALATAMIPALAALTGAQWLRRGPQPRYRPGGWVIVFPIGMYATASLRLGTAGALPLVHRIGAAVTWPAVAAWALMFAAMAAEPLARHRQNERPSAPEQAASRPAPARTRARPRPGRMCPPRKRYKYQALVRLLPSADGGHAVTQPGPGCRLVIRARNHADGSSGLFPALLITRDDDYPLSPRPTVIVTMVVLGHDLADYLDVGDDFALWRGRDVGRGVVTRRIFV